jgi:post-segregation antitoxin (ccd killing protein)
MTPLRIALLGISSNNAVTINAEIDQSSALTGSVENKKGSAPPAIHAVIA